MKKNNTVAIQLAWWNAPLTKKKVHNEEFLHRINYKKWLVLLILLLTILKLT